MPVDVVPACRMAVVGLWNGHVADHVAWARAGGAEVTRVWGADRAETADFAERHGLAAADLDAIVDDRDVDALIVGAATADHARLVSDGIGAGKDVFVEKVLAPTSQETQRLLREADEAGRVLWTSFQRLHEPWFVGMRSLVEAGVLGALTGTSIRLQHDGGLPGGWLQQGAFRPEEACGGVLMDYASHGVSLSMALHGTFPVSVRAVGSRSRGHVLEDNVAVILEYADGALSVLQHSVLAAPRTRWASAHGTGGSVATDPRSDDLLLSTTDTPQWSSVPAVRPEPDPMARFLAARRSGRGAADANADLTSRVIALVEAAYCSWRDARGVDVTDPVTVRHGGGRP